MRVKANLVIFSTASLHCHASYHFPWLLPGILARLYDIDMYVKMINTIQHLPTMGRQQVNPQIPRTDASIPYSERDSRIVQKCSFQVPRDQSKFRLTTMALSLHRCQCQLYDNVYAVSI